VEPLIETIRSPLDRSSFRLRLANGEALFAEKVVRVLPKRRLVVFGTWQGKPVVAKLFISARHAKRDMERDEAGVLLLQENKIPTPPLYARTTNADGTIYVLIFKRILNAKRLDDVWQNKETVDDVLPALRSVIVELATQHVLGVVQNDLHLNNFLLTKKKIYTLDGAQIQLFPRLLPKEKSMENLALFLSQLGVGVEDCQEKLFRHYAKSRGWLLKPTDVPALFLLIKKWNDLRFRRYEKKIFRACTDFSPVKNWHQRGMYDRAHATPELMKFIHDPESVFNAKTATVLKAGRSSTVIKIVLDEKTFVIKRYNIKNTWHRLRRALRATRAATSWRLALKLRLFGVAAAKPIAFIENKFFGIKGKSYLAMEYISEQHIGNYFHQHQGDEIKTNAMVEKITTLLTNLTKLEMTHGDLKMTNIMINQREQPVLIDLDGAVEHASHSGLRKTWQKETQRFLRNFTTMPNVMEKLINVLK
jgi:tRNA A-37 threonylcarbamoyl transferase component Bud32